MATETTLSIIKPAAVKKNVIGEIYDRFEKANLKIIASKMVHLQKKRQVDSMLSMKGVHFILIWLIL